MFCFIITAVSINFIWNELAENYDWYIMKNNILPVLGTWENEQVHTIIFPTQIIYQVKF